MGQCNSAFPCLILNKTPKYPSKLLKGYARITCHEQLRALRAQVPVKKNLSLNRIMRKAVRSMLEFQTIPKEYEKKKKKKRKRKQKARTFTLNTDLLNSVLFFPSFMPSLWQ